MFVFRKRHDVPTEWADNYSDETVTREHRPPEHFQTGRNPWRAHLICMGVMVAVSLILVRLVAGQPMFEKSIKALIAPVGVAWILLFLIAWFSLMYRRWGIALLSISAWLILTIGGNSFTVYWLGRSLQREFESFRLDEAPTVQVLLVLGGGTSATPSGFAQGSQAGDRVLVAAQCVKAEKAELIVCSGTSGLGLVEGELTAGEGMLQLLTRLGVPAERIQTIGGRNTHEELEEFSQWLDRSQQQTQSIGIVTSAWHMKRAMRLAQSSGINAIAIPADFAAGHLRATPHLVIPGADNLHACEMFLFEYLSVIVGR